MTRLASEYAGTRGAENYCAHFHLFFRILVSCIFSVRLHETTHTQQLISNHYLIEPKRMCGYHVIPKSEDTNIYRN